MPKHIKDEPDYLGGVRMRFKYAKDYSNSFYKRNVTANNQQGVSSNA